MSNGFWLRGGGDTPGFLVDADGFRIGDTAGDCGCCGGNKCKCLPPTGTVRWVTYTTRPAGPFTGLTEKTAAAASFEFVSEWIDCTYVESYDTTTSPYVTLPWHDLPQKLEMRMTITGTATAAVAPVSPGYNVTSLTAVLEYRCRYVSYTAGTHTVEADYYAGSRYPSTDSINAPGGINAAESVVFSAQNDYSDEGIITLSDANISVPVRVKYRRSNSSYYLAWSAKTTGIYSVSAGSDIVALTTSPNSGSVSLSLSVHVNNGGSGYTLSASQSYQRITSGIIAVLEDVTTTRTRSYTINSNSAGGWLKTLYVGNAETANADQVANRILSDWVNTWTLYPPSGGSKTLAVARSQYLTTRYFTIHSLNPALHGDMLNFQLVADTYVSRFIVSGATAVRPGQFTAPAYAVTDVERSVTMTYPGGEDVPSGIVLGGSLRPIGAVTIPMPITWDTGVPGLVFTGNIANIPGSYTGSQITWAAGSASISGGGFSCSVSWGAGSVSLPASFGVSSVNIMISLNVVWFYVYSTGNYQSPSGLPAHSETLSTTATNGAPNPLLVKITSVAVDTLPNVAINDTVTKIKVGGSWADPGGDYLATPTGYPAAINYEAGASSTDDTSILFQVKDASGTVIGTGTLASHFAGIEAGAVPSVIDFDYCPYTVGTVSPRCGRKEPPILSSRVFEIGYHEEVYASGEWRAGVGAAGCLLTVVDAGTGVVTMSKTEFRDYNGFGGIYDIIYDFSCAVTCTSSQNEVGNATYSTVTTLNRRASGGVTAEEHYEESFSESDLAENGSYVVMGQGDLVNPPLGGEKWRIVRKAKMTSRTVEQFRVSYESGQSYTQGAVYESYGLHGEVGLILYNEIGTTLVYSSLPRIDAEVRRFFSYVRFSDTSGFNIDELGEASIVCPATGGTFTIPTIPGCLPGKRTWDDIIGVGFPVDGDNNFTTGTKPGTWYFSAYVP